MCPYCHGRKHVLMKGKWIACGCIKILRFKELMRECRIPEVLWKSKYIVTGLVSKLRDESIFAIRLSDFIQAHFEDDQLKNIACTVDCLWMTLDFVKGHKWNVPLLNELLHDRSDKVTILTAQNDLKLNVPFKVIHL